MPDIKEEWRDIEGFEGFYQVSNIGRVRRLLDRHQNSLDRNIILKPQTDRNGYKTVYLSKNNNRKIIHIHRLVAIGFLPNPDNKRCVNHKDGNKANNRVENLEWCTYSENTIHALENRLKIPERGEDVHNAALTNEQADAIRKEYIFRSKEHNLFTLAQKYGVSPSTIHLIVKNKHYKTKE